MRVVDLLSPATAFTKGVRCEAAASAGALLVSKPISSQDTVIEVMGSSSDFEYQYPAAPQYFVGRQSDIFEGEQLLRSLTRPEARARVLVLNAQSGWGKSSLSLRLLHAARALHGDGVCIDCRTATQPTFVSAALRHALLKAQESSLLDLAPEPSFASVASSLQTLRNSRFAARHPLCIFFDQFENIFQNPALTREFRDLALGIGEIQAPVLVGFSWKTDFVAFTESYPYQLRDEIRSAATVFSLLPFGPAETGELLRRLQKNCGQRIHPYLRERIREYSQGLPWLFKKLGSHIIREIGNGATQDELLSEVLNIQRLFDSDINRLDVNERPVLRNIARRVPLSVTEAVDIAGGNRDVVQSLLNQRLLVSIGEKLDIYWDVFRDYLNQGTVPLQESYILRLTPNGVSKLLVTVSAAGGSTTADEAARTLSTSSISVLNMARELRQLGVLAAQEGVLRLSDEIAGSVDISESILLRVSTVLKRHRVYSLLTSLAKPGVPFPMESFVDALPKAYPAVEAKRRTWANYARAFAYWFQYAGFLSISKDELILGGTQVARLDLMKPGKKRTHRGLELFPRSQFNPVLNLLEKIDEKKSISNSSSVRKALADARFLNLIEEPVDNSLVLTSTGEALVASAEGNRSALVRQLIEGQPAFQVAYQLIINNPACAPTLIGRGLAKKLGVDWSDSTANWAGKCVRGWMRAAGVATTPSSKSREASKRRRRRN